MAAVWSVMAAGPLWKVEHCVGRCRVSCQTVDAGYIERAREGVIEKRKGGGGGGGREE